MTAVITATILLAACLAPSAETDAIHPIAGGTFEASGAVSLGSGVLFVDDSRSEEVYWMALDGEGRQVGPAERVALGIAIPDMEGITTDGTYVYVVGSQSKVDSQSGAGLARFKFDPHTREASDLQAIDDLKAVILTALPDVARAAGRRVDGFNIEGLAWDPDHKQLLLGLRSPVPNGQALVIPLMLRNPESALSADNVEVNRDGLQRLPMPGGIRSLEYDADTKSFRIISGADGHPEAGFSFWRWSGAGAPQREHVLPQVAARAGKPEGITRVLAGPESYTLVVFDTSRYVTMR